MSACGRAIDFLRDWRDGKGQPHQHEWGDECQACIAEDYDEYRALTHAAAIMGWLPDA